MSTFALTSLILGVLIVLMVVLLAGLGGRQRPSPHEERLRNRRWKSRRGR